MLSFTIAHSPDPDDAFMFYALSQGLLPEAKDVNVTHVLQDIETLNRKALEGAYEVSAVSIHAYAHLADRYALMGCGASVGDGYGPIVISRDPLSLEDLSRVEVAIPGTLTTAFLALQLACPRVRHTILPFDEIMPAVEQGRVPAGLIIHEGQVTYKEKALHPVLDLGIWFKERTGLPLPLGGNVVRRDLGDATVQRITRLVKASIEFALKNRQEALQYARGYGRGIERNLADKFVSMYVNEFTRDYGEVGRQSVVRLLRDGYDAGILPRLVTPEFVR